MNEYQKLPNFAEANGNTPPPIPNPASQHANESMPETSNSNYVGIDSGLQKHTDFSSPDIPAVPGAVIEIRNLSKKYGSLLALDNVNLNLAAGRVIGLMGPNGCGKTTMLKILSGLMLDFTGEVAICGMRVSEKTKGLISFLPDAPALPAGMRISTAFDMYQDFFKDFEREKAKDLLGHFQIDVNSKFRELSKGNKEKLQVVMTMSRNARIYILDEPLSGVDPASRQVILDGIIRGYRPDALMLLSTHLIQDVEYVVDEAIFMQNGKIALHGNADEIRQRSGKSLDATFREMFACLVNW